MELKKIPHIFVRSFKHYGIKGLLIIVLISIIEEPLNFSCNNNHYEFKRFKWKFHIY